jgi:large repetitive protein
MKKFLSTLFAVFFITSSGFSQIGGYALSFDGVDDYVSVPHNSNLNFTSFTVEAWIFPTALDSKIIGKTAYGSAVPGFNMGFTSDSKLYFECKQDWGSGCIAGGSSQTVSLNVWTHVAMSWSSGGYLKGYINGVEVLSVVSPALTITNSNSLVIGRAPWIDPNQGAFKGKIDEVRIWNLVRTQAQIKTCMSKELAGNESGLVGYYKMSNGSGTTLSDNQTYTTVNNATINGPLWKTSGCFAGPKNCLDFDGIDDYVSITNGVVLGTTFTQEMWIYPTDATETYRGLLGQQPSNSPSRCPCVYQFGKKVHFGMGNGTTWYSDTTYNDVLTINSWNHIAVTFDGTTYLVYVNGRLIYTSLCASGLIPLNAAQSGIGKVDNYFVGKIDEVRIWSTVRTETQIRENIMSILAGNETGLQAYYRMDYSDGTALYDITSNARNGTLTNMDPATDWVISGAFNTWIGSESNAWSTAANWSNGSVPVSTDNIGVYKWAIANELLLSGTPTLNHMIISSTSSPTLNSNFTVNGELIIDKDVNLNGYVITLGANGYLTEGNFRLYGTTGSITTTRTLNNISALNVGGLGAVITSSANMGSTTIIRGHTSQGGSQSILRYYDITPTTNTGLNATLVFNYNDNEINGNTETDLKLFKSTNSGTNWTVQNTSVVNTTNNTITLSGIDGFSRWTAANYNSSMPVELVSFTSALRGRDIRLCWVTNKETNNIGFDIERKTTETQWTKIGFVNGKGTTNESTSYSFSDTKLNPGKYYYRLKQIDLNGNFNYHNLNGLVEIGIPSKFSLSQNYPNPFNPATTIEFQISENSYIVLKVYNMAGKEIATLLNEKLQAGYYNVPFSINRFSNNCISSGVYFYKLTTEKFSAVKKMVVLK